MIQPLSKLGPSGLTRRQEKARQARQDVKARRACVDAVWQRAQGRCEQCGVVVYRPRSGVVWTRYGHVHEVLFRSRGGSPIDMENVVLLCVPCHQQAHGLRGRTA